MRTVRRLSEIFVWMAVLFGAATANAATITVCASGCQYSDLQAAINAAVPGDTLMLRAGETFTGNYNLPVKSGTGWITIRSDAPDSQLPPDGVRLVPSGKTGANTSRTLLPRLVGKGGALKTTAVVSADSGAHNYKLQFLEIDGSANLGYETLVQLGPAAAVAPPTDIIMDRVYMHGHFTKGQKRGVALNGVRLDILNSYISDIKSVNSDSQGICSYNGAGPFRILNNYIEAAAENILFGGAAPSFANLVGADVMVQHNMLTKPLAWQNPILSAPAASSAVATTGGSLAAGTHYFKIVAVLYTDSVTAVSLPSNEMSATVGASGAVTLSWSAVAGADNYRIYHGTTSGAEDQYLEVPGTSVTFTGVPVAAAALPTAATYWTVKNIFEIKNGERITIDANILENVWAAGQAGYAIMLTPRNSDLATPWARVKDITITNNIVRHASGVVDILGHDDANTSGTTSNVTITNNSFEDIDNVKYGGGAKAVLIGLGASTVTFNHNTFIHNNTALVYAYGPEQMPGFVFTNNVAKHNDYGVMGEASSLGNPTIAKFFPGGVFTCDTFAGGPAGSYPAPNAFPTVAQWTSSFVNYAGGDYRLATTAYDYTAGCADSTPGTNWDVLTSAQGTPAPAPGPAPTPPPTTNVAPIAHPGGPYAATVGTAVTVNGSGSTDSDGSVTSWRWTWGDDVLVRAADLPATAIHGTAWARAADATAAGGFAISNPDHGAAKLAAAASPASYVEFTVQVAAGVPYRMWFRMKAAGDSYSNDSMSVQFSGAVDSTGAAVNRIGTTGAAAVILEEGSGAGVSGWGWNDAAYGTMAVPVYFATTGTQTVRIQQREDGIMWDQFVLSAGQYRASSPGLLKLDTTILPTSFGAATGVTSSHTYATAGSFPVGLTVTDNAGATGSASTTANVAASGTPTATLQAKSGGPYSGAIGAAVQFNGTGSTVPAGTTATYSWQFGDEVVLHASNFAAADLHGRWALVNDTTAADGVTLENADLGDAKIGTALAAPTSYVEATVKVAAGVPYHLYLRMRANANSYSNDSVWVQFSGSTTSAGAAAYRIGTTDALAIVLQEGNGAALADWGWNDANYGALAGPIYFNADGTQTIRIQQREDGIRIDQIVLSAGQYANAAPGALVNDAKVVPVVAATGAQPLHAYPVAGTFPVVLTVKTTQGSSVDTTTAVVR